MKKILFGLMPLILAFTLIGCTSKNLVPAKTTLQVPSPKVAKLIKQYNLEVVDKDYVCSKLGKGTKSSVKAILIDARPAKKYSARTIPSSINIPDTKFEEYYANFSKTPKDKELIVYCGGWDCAKSPKVAKLLRDKGYTNVKLYQAGEPEWTKKAYAEVGTSIVKVAQQNNSALIIDARGYKKFLAETIPGAIAIPDTQLAKLYGRFPADKNTPIITFCGGYECTKSHKVAKKLLSLGYTNVSVYAGGLPQWQKDGLKTTKCKQDIKIAKQSSKSTKTSPFLGPIKKGGDEGSVDGEWFLKNYQNLPKNVTIIDVRGTDERKVGFIENSIHVSIEENKPKAFISKLPKTGYMIFHCSAGGRSIEAYELIKNEKFSGLDRAVYLDANIKCKGNQCNIEPNEPLDPIIW